MLNIITKIGYQQLPRWAHPDHPIMKNVMGHGRARGWRVLLMRFFFWIGAIAAAIGLGYAIANRNTQDPTVREILYWPLVGGQILAMVIGVALTANVIAIERQKQTWDSLKLSLTGVSLTLRARWISVYFRLWWLLAAITIGRLVYIGFFLRDMAEFQGRALDLYISGIDPEISLDGAVLLLTALLTAFILQPFIEVGLAAAIGIIVAVFTHTRSVVILGLLLLIGLRLAISVSALLIGTTIFEASGGVTLDLYQMETSRAWYRLMLTSLEGDMGLKLMNLETLGQIWADVKNSVYIGGAMLVAVVVLGLIADGLVRFSAWRATKPTSL